MRLVFFPTHVCHFFLSLKSDSLMCFWGFFFLNSKSRANTLRYICYSSCTLYCIGETKTKLESTWHSSINQIKPKHVLNLTVLLFQVRRWPVSCLVPSTETKYASCVAQPLFFFSTNVNKSLWLCWIDESESLKRTKSQRAGCYWWWCREKSHLPFTVRRSECEEAFVVLLSACATS